MIATLKTDASAAGSTAANAPIVLLRVEGLALLSAVCVAYQMAHGSWLLFAALFLAPDGSMAAYAFGPRFGALGYNLFHTTTTYFVILGLGIFLSAPLLLHVGLIGLAHAGFDRFAGYGLKYPTQFKDTHLTRLQEKGA